MKTQTQLIKLGCQIYLSEDVIKKASEGFPDSVKLIGIESGFFKGVRPLKFIIISLSFSSIFQYTKDLENALYSIETIASYEHDGEGFAWLNSFVEKYKDLESTKYCIRAIN